MGGRGLWSKGRSFLKGMWPLSELTAVREGRPGTQLKMEFYVDCCLTLVFII